MNPILCTCALCELCLAPAEILFMGRKNNSRIAPNEVHNVHKVHRMKIGKKSLFLLSLVSQGSSQKVRKMYLCVFYVNFRLDFGLLPNGIFFIWQFCEL